MEFEEITGIAKKTADKLRTAGFTMENIHDTTLEELIEKTGIHNSLANEILEKINDNQENETNDELNNTQTTNNTEIDQPVQEANLDYDINKASEFLLDIFKESEEYHNADESESEAIIYDRWRKNQNKRLITG